MAERTLSALIKSRFDSRGTQEAQRAFQGVAKGGQGLDASVGMLNNTYVKLGATIAGVGVVMNKTFDLGAAGAQIERLRNAGEDLAAGFGVSFGEIQDKVRDASLNTVSDLDIMRAANRAMMLGVSADAEQLGKLMEVAAFRGRAMGMSTTQAFQDIVTGVGRMSPMILDNLGIVVDAESKYVKYAASMGITTDAIDSATKRQILLNSVLDEGQKQIAAAGGLAEDTATKYEQMEAAVANAGDALKEDLAPYIAKSAEGLYLLLTYGDQVTGMLQDHEDAALEAGKSYVSYADEQLNAAVAAGFLAETQADVIRNSIENADLLRLAKDRYGDLSDATLAQARANGELGLSEVNRIRELREEAEAAEALMAKIGMLTEAYYRAYSAVMENVKAGKYNIQEQGMLRNAIETTTKQYKLSSAAVSFLNRTLASDIQMMEDQADASGRASSAAYTYQAAQEAAAAAVRAKMTELGTYVSGPLGREIEDFTEGQAELEQQASDVMDEIDRLKAAGYGEQSTKVQELRGEYEDLQGQITANADAHEEATKRIVFDLIQQRLAVSGLTDAQQADALMVIAEQMGLIDAPTRAFYESLKLIDPLLASENPEGYAAAVDHLRKAAADGAVTAEELRQALALLDGMTVDAYIQVHQVGNADATGWSRGGYQDPDNNNNGGYQDPDAGGAMGLDMDVPPGHPADSFMIGATSGEHVTITKPGQNAGGATVNNYNSYRIVNNSRAAAATNLALIQNEQRAKFDRWLGRGER